MAKSTAVATKAEAKLPAASASFMGVMDQAAGVGLENVGATDIIIPRLTILQGLSPQVSQGKPEFDKNARVGEIYDIGLQERFPEGIQFVPVHYTKQWLEWAPRASGKGLVKVHDTNDILGETDKDDRGRDTLPNGNYIAETAQFFGINLTADNRKSFIPMTSTQLKKARRLLTLATSEKLKRDDGSEFTPPLFFRTYQLTTVPESNAEGNWMGWKIERSVALNELPGWEAILSDIQSFRSALTSGALKGDVASLDETAAAPGPNDRM